MTRVESTKGAGYEKFLVVSCDGTEILDTALTLQEATTKLADMADGEACFVLKLLRTTDVNLPVKVFHVKSRPARLIEYAQATPPHVVTEHEPGEIPEPEEIIEEVTVIPAREAEKKPKVAPKAKVKKKKKVKVSPAEEEIEHRTPAEIPG